MNVSSYSIKNPIPAILIFILVTIAGLLAFKHNTVQDFPDIELPIVIVSASLPGASPAQLETDVARKIEDAIANIQNLKNTYTTVSDGAVNVMAEFELEKPLSEATNDVRDAVSAIRADLPSDMRDPVVSKIPTAGRVIEVYSVDLAQRSNTQKTLNDNDRQTLSWFIDHTVKQQLLTVTGVGDVKRSGGALREIQVVLQPEQLAALGITASEVSNQLRISQLDVPSGQADVGGGEQTIRTFAAANQVGDIANMAIAIKGGRYIRLSQIAEIKDTVADVRAIAEVDGREIVAFEVFRSKGASELDVASGTAKQVALIAKQHPEYNIQRVIDNASPIKENYQASMSLLYEGALLAVLVILWFLRDWRAMLVATAALPLSVIPTFLGLSYFGYSINTVTLLALALVVGVLVDDAIVEIENIERHLRMGKKPAQAAMDAANEIGMAVIATTFALVAVFLPTAFMGGVPGLFFKQFGWTAVIAVLSSLAVARMLTPMMAAYFLKPKPHTAVKDGWIMQRYLSAARWAVSHPWYSLWMAFMVFVSSLAIVPLLPTGFVPSSDRNQTQVTLELAPGSTLEETQASAEAARLAAMRVPHVVSVYSSIGGGSSGDAFAPGVSADVRKAVLTITTTAHQTRALKLSEIDGLIREELKQIAGARFNVGPPDTGVKMQLMLTSEDPVALDAVAKRVVRELRTLQGVGNVSSSAALVRPEIKIIPDLQRIADLGITADSIGRTLRVATAGDYDVALSKFNLPERQIYIRVKLPDSVRDHMDRLSGLSVPSHAGPVMLGNIAQLKMASGPAQIDRLNRSRKVTFDVELGVRTLGEVTAEARALPALQNLPPQVHIFEGGDAEEMVKLFASFGVAMFIGVLCIYAVLVLLFHDFIQPITILTALPLSMGGAFIALLLTGKALSMPSMIGLIMLMGVVSKNSILLVDYVVLARRSGMDRLDALLDACHKRARPIVMTSIAMIAGMMPLAFGFGADPSFRSPMAVTVIGGLVMSTLLSLLVVPVVYLLFDRFKETLKKLFVKVESSIHLS